MLWQDQCIARNLKFILVSPSDLCLLWWPLFRRFLFDSDTVKMMTQLNTLMNYLCIVRENVIVLHHWQVLSDYYEVLVKMHTGRSVWFKACWYSSYTFKAVLDSVQWLLIFYQNLLIHLLFSDLLIIIKIQNISIFLKNSLWVCHSHDKLQFPFLL